MTSHWHGDHHFGNAAFREAYPGVVFVAHAETRRLMLPKGPEGLAQLKQVPTLHDKYKTLLARGEVKPGVPLDQRVRDPLVLALPRMEATLDDDTDVTLVPPELGLSLEDTRKKVDLAALRDAFAGQDAGQRLTFDLDFAEPAIGRAYEEAKGKIGDE